MSRDCDRWRGDVALYVIGALNMQERAAMRLHLATCSACRAEYEQLLHVRDWLDWTKRHLAICPACRADYQEFFRPRPPTGGPQAEDQGDGCPHFTT
jgi:predicted anti-sigma-YlaC factor YlaD